MTCERMQLSSWSQFILYTSMYIRLLWIVIVRHSSCELVSQSVAFTRLSRASQFQRKLRRRLRPVNIRRNLFLFADWVVLALILLFHEISTSRNYSYFSVLHLYPRPRQYQIQQTKRKQRRIHSLHRMPRNDERAFYRTKLNVATNVAAVFIASTVVCTRSHTKL